MIQSFFDPVLAVGLIVLSWVALASRDLFRAVILFIAFGLLMALAWVRLEAPDIALAEAAIGAGLTGAILLDALGQFGGNGRVGGRGGGAPAAAGTTRTDSTATGGDGERVRWRAFLSSRRAVASTAAVLLLFVLLLRTVLELPSEAGGLTLPIAGALEQSGATNPVTAVLLNFRMYDTWLEVVVLLVAIMSVLLLRRQTDLSTARVRASIEPMLGGMTRTLLPLMVLVGGYLLWRGTHAPGGAFQAGAILGSMGVLLLLAGYRPFRSIVGLTLRSALVAGVAAFLVLGVVLLLLGRGFLVVPPAHAGRVILLVEGAVTVSIALTLTALFAGATVPVESRSDSHAMGATRGEGEEA